MQQAGKQAQKDHSSQPNATHSPGFFFRSRRKNVAWGIPCRRNGKERKEPKMGGNEHEKKEKFDAKRMGGQDTQEKM
jgi:hypothetical protein